MIPFYTKLKKCRDERSFRLQFHSNIEVDKVCSKEFQHKVKTTFYYYFKLRDA